MKKLFLYSFLVFSLVTTAQEKDKHLPQGNEAFAEKKYAEAEAEYRISHANNPKKSIAAYNLGTSIYKQDQYNEAKSHFLKSIQEAKTKTEKHQAFHNLGNAMMKEKDYAGAVEAYKNALRNNPDDEETRYNYALAKLYLKNNPPKNNDKDKDKNKDKKDDKKDKEDKSKDDKNEKDKDKDKKDDKGKDKEDKNKNESDKNEEKPQPKPGGISKQRLESLLEAVNNEEKKVQDKVNLQKAKGKPVKTEKDW